MLTGDFAGLRRLQRSFRSIADPNGDGRTGLLKGVRTEINGVIRAEFAEGIGPDGTSWQRTVRGGQPLFSKVLPHAFESRAEGGELRYVAYTKRDFLTAHQFGHTFPARVGGGNSLFFDEKGRALKQGKLSGSRIKRIKFVQEVKTRTHTVGQRVLPARPIYPTGALPLRWEEAIHRGLTAGMERWAEKAEK